jgi:hypothetical protein
VPGDDGTPLRDPDSTSGLEAGEVGQLARFDLHRIDEQ